jgi:hypothetical protein
MTCVCHSLALCASNACGKLPTDIESLLHNIYNHFKNSFKRLSEYIPSGASYTRTREIATSN